MESPSKRAFISYSWTSEEHVGWVVDLAEKLMDDGIDIILDQWDLREGQDKHDFMEQSVKDDSIDRVLVICDREYARKANEREGGVGTETQIISPEVYEDARQEKFIPVLAERGTDEEPAVPVFLRGRMYIDLSDPRTYYEQYDKLLRNVLERPRRTKPELGEPPSHILEEGKDLLATTHRLKAFEDAVMRDRAHVHGLAEDFLEKLLEEAGQLTLRSEDGENAGERVDAAVKRFGPYRDEFAEFVRIVARYRPEPDTIDVLKDFFTKWLGLAYSPHVQNREPELDHWRFLLYEMTLYALTILISRNQFNLATRFLTGGYVVPGDDDYAGQPNACDWTILQPFVHSFEEVEYGRKGQVDRLLCKGCEESEAVPYSQLSATDYTLFMRNCLSEQAGQSTSQRWWPYTLSSGKARRVYQLFLRAESADVFSGVSQLLGVKGKDQLDELFQAACTDEGRIPRIDSLWGDKCRQHSRLMNLEKLATR